MRQVQITLAFVLAAACAAAQEAPVSRPDHLGGWIDLRIGQVAEYAGHSSFRYKTERSASSSDYDFTFVLTPFGRTDDGLVRLMRVVRVKSPDKGFVPRSEWTFLRWDPAKATVTPEPIEGIRFGVSGPRIPDTLWPTVSPDDLATPHTWTRRRPWSDDDDPADAMDFAFSTRAVPSLGADFVEVEYAPKGPMPIKLMTDTGGLAIRELRRTFVIDRAGRRLVSLKKSFGCSFSGTDQDETCEIRETARRLVSGDEWKDLEAQHATLLAVDHVIGKDPAAARALTADFRRRFPKSPMLDIVDAMDNAAGEYEKYIKTDAAEKAVTQAMIGKPAPDFTLNDLDGKPLSLSSLKGKVVLISFWGVG